jgi:ABC-type taurine transport system substrate-binding protein
VNERTEEKRKKKRDSGAFAKDSGKEADWRDFSIEIERMEGKS